MLRILFLVFYLVLLGSAYGYEALAKDENPDTEEYEAILAKFPKKLSEWKIFKAVDGKIKLHESVFVYYLKNSLFSDYASKIRAIWIPPGKQILYHERESFTFPVGSVIAKTFAYRRDELELQLITPPRNSEYSSLDHDRWLQQHQLIETRILVLTEEGWIGLPYIWNSEQLDANLVLIGRRFNISLKRSEIGRVSFDYLVPNYNQCKSCHIKIEEFTKKILPIGPKAKNLNFSVESAGVLKNQLEIWEESGILAHLPRRAQIPELPKWDDPESGSAAERARAYLDINCAHCHNPEGPGSTSALFLNFELANPIQYGVCKSPVAPGNGGSDMRFDIMPGQAERSILYHRLKSVDPAVMMPEIGRSLAHRKGLKLIYQWISEMEGSCSFH